MLAVFRAVIEYCKTSLREALAAWDFFWFTPADPTTLAAMRIGTGLCLLYLYLGCLTNSLDYVGPNAWVDSQAVTELMSLDTPDPYVRYGWSVWYLVDGASKSYLLLLYLLGATVCFTLGLFSRISNLAVWIGHLSFVHRSLLTWYGVDVVLSMLLFYMLCAPTGDALSLDRLLKRYWSGSKGAVPLQLSWTTNLSIRAIQVHMCIIYLCSGLSKLQGESWWDGSAIWQVLMIHELGPFDFRWLSLLDDRLLLALSSLGVVATLAFEISFAYLIWNPRLRPLLLALAVVLHGMIGALMGLGVFSAVMLTGCLSFVSPVAIKWLIEHLTTTPHRREVALPCGDVVDAGSVAQEGLAG